MNFLNSAAARVMAVGFSVLTISTASANGGVPGFSLAVVSTQSNADEGTAIARYSSSYYIGATKNVTFGTPLGYVRKVSTSSGSTTWEVAIDPYWFDCVHNDGASSSVEDVATNSSGDVYVTG